ncbi:hypothetical protein B0H19DRAFT_1124397 [Mycena capillaripes]|nr:hypothetical protein B0H19DRAFT_1124397 [Mycena capillaripes]
MSRLFALFCAVLRQALASAWYSVALVDVVLVDGVLTRSDPQSVPVSCHGNNAPEYCPWPVYVRVSSSLSRITETGL